VQRSALLTNRFGGEKENNNYALLRTACRVSEKGEYLAGLKVEQNAA
jgi:hypothetical protein